MDMKPENWSGTVMRPVGLVLRQKDPNNLEMPFDQLDDFITPAELFYIRSHFPTPQLDPVTYRLAIAGAVRDKLSLSYADVRAMPSRTCIATLECAGNGRVFLSPPVPGAQWQLGAVAMLNGRVFHFPWCWSAPAWPMMCARSFWKAPIAA
jgi:DMSO/TMAO reductase YedYZ molybdopterin-dependent catalytic subunit